MASTYSTSLRLELIGQGEQSGTWGVTTNNNFGALVEQAITGVQTITMGDATYTLTSYDGAVDESRNAVLVLGGTVTVPQNLIAPGVEKVYIIKNGTGATITIKTATGTGVAITNNNYAQVYCDGTDFYNATPNVNTITGNLSVSGNASIAGNTGIGGDLSVTGTISAGSIAGINGRILQIVVGTSGAAYTSSGTYSATGMSAVISPTSATSKILILAHAMMWQTNAYGGGNAFTALFRNGANLAPGADWTIVSGNPMYNDMAISHLDSPGVTTALTYEVYIKADSGGSAAFNSSGNAGSIIAMEISQ